MIFVRLAVYIFMAWVIVYTISYGRWTWKRKNRLGAIMIYIVALITLALPIYSAFVRY